MLKDKIQLEQLLLYYITSNVQHGTDLSEQQKWFIELKNKYNIPINMSSDIISQRKDISEYNNFILYAITDVIRPDKIKEFFTEQEIKMYSVERYESVSVKFPKMFHLIKVDDDQYIGAINARDLMRLREEQMIHYNAETQRALRILVKGGEKILRPFVNESAVKEITEDMENGSFIPNAITLNINLDDPEADYVYDDKTETLKIYKLTAFDIVDGYHRYLAMGRNYDRDNKWDYRMELRITTFSVSRARQFISQENKKTLMKEEDLSAYDQNSPGNIVVNRLNSDTDSNLKGKIDLRTGLIHSGILAQVINRLYFPKKVERRNIIITTKEIKTSLNRFTEEEIEYLDKTWSTYEIITVMYGISQSYTPSQINAALLSLSQDQIEILDKAKDINVKVVNILKEVY